MIKSRCAGLKKTKPNKANRRPLAGNPKQDEWVRNDIAGGSDWHWDVVHSSEDGNKEVEWTMSAGTYTLNIAYREEGALLDAIVITKID
jgi:hypothetical protein